MVEQEPAVPEEYTDSAARQPSASGATEKADSELPAQKKDGPSTSVTDAGSQLTAAQQMGHGGVGTWLAHNFEVAEADPASPRGTVHRRRTPSADAETHPGNLLQIPGGALFGTNKRPTPEETEELLRYAAAAQGEMQQDAETRRRPPDVTGDSGDDAAHGQASTDSS